MSLHGRLLREQESAVMTITKKPMKKTVIETVNMSAHGLLHKFKAIAVAIRLLKARGGA